MDLQTLVKLVYGRYRGKENNVPASGDPKYTQAVDTANMLQRDWASDGEIDWPSRYEIRELGTLSVGTQTYDLDDDIIRPSDYVYVTDANGNKRYFNLVQPQARSRYTEGAYISGFDPKSLTFITNIGTDLSGYTLSLPCYTMPEDMVSPNDPVAVDDPNWLVWATAAELARNDPAKDDQFADLNGIANDRYLKMVTKAQSNAYLQPSGAMNNMPQMGDAWSDYNPWRTS